MPCDHTQFQATLQVVRAGTETAPTWSGTYTLTCSACHEPFEFSIATRLLGSGGVTLSPDRRRVTLAVRPVT